MPLEELVLARREDILQTAARHGAYNVRIFGSVARGDADKHRIVIANMFYKRQSRYERYSGKTSRYSRSN
jgi:uncharacterized protein